jgi:hypothetical protein
MGLIKEFIIGSKYFNGMSIQGIFGLPIDIFEIALEHYKKTGENVLDEYAEIIYLIQDAKNFDPNDIYPNYICSPFKIMSYKEILDHKNFWKIEAFSTTKDRAQIRKYITASEKRIKFLKSYKNKREKACKYISNPTIRKKIFKRDGKKCAKCGTKKDLTIDHIKSIYHGGKNELDNLQVLCKSCNSSKGVKIKDYRNNKGINVTT